MRQSSLFSRTRKAVSKEASVVSHQLLVRADFIDQLAAGVYSLLPLGLRSFKKIESIIREEMDLLGGQEICMPTLAPKSLWQETGRWETIDPPLFTVTDRHHKELALGPTHEEVVTDLVRRRVNSYKDLPFSLYQIQNKFRNEMRSTGGLLRVREFIMKDLYSFHADEKDLDVFYQKAAKAYKRIYNRCGLNVVMVEAGSGSIGGNQCHEFMVLADSGEDTVLVCPKCAWAANVEIAKVGSPCPVCGAKVEEKKGIEAGHIFKLDTKYSAKMGANFVNDKGVSQPIFMGCYGIGLGRLLATIVEASHDDRGMIWPETVAPFKAHLISLHSNKKTDKIYHELIDGGVEVLYDDRDLSAGEKFSDADLIGLPYRFVVSEKTGDRVEMKKRIESKTKLITVAEMFKVWQ